MQILLKEYILNRIQSFTNKFKSSANRIKFLIAGIVFHTLFQFKLQSKYRSRQRNRKPTNQSYLHSKLLILASFFSERNLPFNFIAKKALKVFQL